MEVRRGGRVESVHRVHVAVVDAAGRLRARAGEPDRWVFARSTAKPFQALPLVQTGVAARFGVTEEELAVACGSHAGAPEHVAVVERLLARAGLGEQALGCGVHAPWDASTRRALRAAGADPRPVHHNCSGKHAAMLVLARGLGWPTDGYLRPEHPVQRRVWAEMARWAGMAEEAVELAVDGCGVPTFRLPLRQLALAYARLGAAARRGEEAPAAVVGAMIRHPELVAGRDRLCTDLMRVTAGRLVAKLGAEGVYAVAAPGAELGIAWKVEDGAFRAVGPAVLAALEQLELLTEEELGRLQHHAFPEVHNTRGERVGELWPVGRLEAA
mgnify:CR=1 FL=1